MLPFGSGAITFAPECKSALRLSTSPDIAAQCSEVRPRLLVASTSTPRPMEVKLLPGVLASRVVQECAAVPIDCVQACASMQKMFSIEVPNNNTAMPGTTLIVEHLLHRSADPHTIDPDGSILLYGAAGDGPPATVRLLLGAVR